MKSDRNLVIYPFDYDLRDVVDKDFVQPPTHLVMVQHEDHYDGLVRYIAEIDLDKLKSAMERYFVTQDISEAAKLTLCSIFEVKKQDMGFSGKVQRLCNKFGEIGLMNCGGGAVEVKINEVSGLINERAEEFKSEINALYTKYYTEPIISSEILEADSGTIHFKLTF